MKHIATIHISNDEIERVNRLLNIESLEDMSDDDFMRHGANTNYNEGIFSVTFDDGSSLNFDLCSGTHNYWDDVVWTSADGNIEVTLECEYELSDIEVEIDGETYVVKIINDGQGYNRIKELWLEFGDVPMNPETECLEFSWHGFQAGTHREEVWHWFEETFNVSVYDLMYSRT